MRPCASRFMRASRSHGTFNWGDDPALMDPISRPASRATSATTAVSPVRGKRASDRRERRPHATEPEVIRAGADSPLAARSHHVARAVLLGAQERAAAVDALTIGGML